jgi:SSS family solute:Na+ symporter
VYTRTSFFFVCRFLIPGLWGIAALASLAPEAFAGLPPDLESRRSLYAMPLYLATVVPVGLMGLLIAAMLAADMSTDSSYMLTWGGVIYNDLLAPFRRGRWPERRALRWNRSILAGIGLFLLVYGLWYPLRGDVWSYLTVTGSIYLASMSVMLVACCYWRRANDWGAAGAILFGALFPVGFLVLEQLPATKDWAAAVGPNWSGIASFAAAAAAMVAGSLLKPQPRSA